MNIAIIGLGLMGCSLALNFKKNKDIVSIAGYDKSMDNQDKALELGCINRIISFDECKKYDVIIIATPVNIIKEVLEKLNDVNQLTTIIDLGSTKENIINSVPNKIRKNYVAGHPIAGTENSGPTAAFEELYHNRKMIFCNLNDSGEYQRKIAIDIFTKIGMKIILMDANEHDLYMASISHLPHLLSYALTNSILKQKNSEKMLDIIGGGFRDMARLSKSPPIMWIDIFTDNKKNLLEILSNFENEIAQVRNYIEDDNKEELKKWILNANKIKEN